MVEGGGGSKHSHLIGKEVTLNHPGGKAIWGGKVIKTHDSFEHPAHLVGQKAKVIGAQGNRVLVEHGGKQYTWPGKHAKE